MNDNGLGGKAVFENVSIKIEEPRLLYLTLRRSPPLMHRDWFLSLFSNKLRPNFVYVYGVARRRRVISSRSRAGGGAATNIAACHSSCRVPLSATNRYCIPSPLIVSVSLSGLCSLAVVHEVSPLLDVQRIQRPRKFYFECGCPT